MAWLAVAIFAVAVGLLAGWAMDWFADRYYGRREGTRR